jgi:hypothetical protein
MTGRSITQMLLRLYLLMFLYQRDITVYCDAHHAGCLMTRHSHSRIIIFIQGAPIIWYSKRQNAVESADSDQNS